MRHHFKIAEWLSHLLDDQIKFGPLSFGLDPILGLIPFAGDIFSTVLSLYIVWIAIQMKIPGNKIAEMIGNIAIDFLIGLVPIFGQISDFFFKSNKRNMDILRQYVKSEVIDGEIIR
jgi:hypothetical protein